MIKTVEEENEKIEAGGNSSEPIAPSAGREREERKGISGETSRSQGVLLSLAETWAMAMFSPRRLFQVPTGPGAGWAMPLTYAIVVGTTGVILSLPGLYLIGNSWGQELGWVGEGFSRNLLLLLLIVAPVISFFKVLIGSGILHLFVIWMGGREGWENTLRIVAYSESTEVLKVFPYLGGIAANIYKLPLYVWGLRESQGLSPARSILVVAAPFLALLVVVLVLASLLVVSATSLLIWE